MTRILACSLGIAICGAACGGGARSPDCGWRDEPATRLDLNDKGDQRHLSGDARLAEELAIRYADVTRGRRSGRYRGPDEYHRAREQCFERLSGVIATRHGISPAAVAGAVGRRDGRVDAIVLLVFAALYGFAANGSLRALFVRFPPDEPWPALIATAAGAIAFSATGVIFGGLGASIVEMIQLGDMHMSYRADRLPWAQHSLLIFSGGVVIFVIIASIRWRRSADVLHSDSPSCGPSAATR